VHEESIDAACNSALSNSGNCVSNVSGR